MVQTPTSLTAMARAGYGQVEHLVHELAKFGVVGFLALIIDVGLFNVLRYAGDPGLFYDKPLTAKFISVVAATTFAYFGNRLWTFRERGRTSFVREYVLFFLLNGVALGITLSVLWFTHYALGHTSALADNLSANVLGLGLGTAFRFWSYRKWVFPATTDDDVVEQVGASAV